VSEDLNQFWNLLSSSGLIAPLAVENLVAESKTKKGLDQVSKLAQWLVDKNAVSQYQADVLASGQATDFLFGNYRLLERISNLKSGAEFIAVHRSGYRVRLQFLSGEGPADVKRWMEIEQRANRLAGCKHPNLSACFETVKLPANRMVVSEIPTAKPLVDLMPGKARLQWEQASRLGLQLVCAVDELHGKQIPHRAICPSAIRLLAADSIRLDVDPFLTNENWIIDQPESVRAEVERYQALEISDQERTQTSAFAADMYSVGSLLFRMVAGRDFVDLNTSERSELLAKRDVPEWFCKTIENLTSSVPSLRTSSSKLVDTLSENGVELPAAPASDPRADFRAAISQAMPGADLMPDEPVVDWAAPAIEGVTQKDFPTTIEFSTASDVEAAEDASDRIAKAQASIQRRQKLQWLQPLLVLGSCLLVGCVFAGIYMFGDQISLDKSAQSDSQPDRNARKSKDNVAVRFAARNAEDPISDGVVPVVSQVLVEDDGTTLWETPTEGGRLELDFLPPAPKIVLHLRPKQLLAQPEGQRMEKAMGPDFFRTIEQFSASVGIAVEELEELVVSFHQNEEEYYQWFAVVSCSSDSKAELLETWGDFSQRQSIDGEPIYENDDGLGYFLIDDRVDVVANDESPDSAANAGTDSGDLPVDLVDGQPAVASQPDGQNDDSPVRFLVGPADLVKSVVDVGRGFPLAGSLQRIQEFSDRDRHVNLLYLRPSLFNDRGQNWMGARLLDFNRQLSELLPDEVKGGLASLHIDGGNYIEFVFDRSVDIKVDELKTQLQQGIELRVQSLLELNRRIPSDDYWQALQNRFEKMVAESLAQVRWGVEDRELVGNAWLPSVASHNLIAASELLATFRLAAVDPTAQQTEVPQSLAELLEKKRDLDIANPPDLNVLMADLETEVGADYSGLPFKWRIVLLGGDLEKDGITKNQRPGPLKLDQKTFAEILTSIVVSANPDKNISGPEDPACKLIWVVAEDPEFPDQKAVLITTRDAAKEKSYQLPKPFVTQ
jgi:hypothetical protein